MIGHQLTENDGPENLMTGIHSFNVDGMLPFENFMADYIETTENHLHYRVTPVFEDDNLLASGVYMEVYSTHLQQLLAISIHDRPMTAMKCLMNNII